MQLSRQPEMKMIHLSVRKIGAGGTFCSLAVSSYGYHFSFCSMEPFLLILKTGSTKVESTRKDIK